MGLSQNSVFQDLMSNFATFCFPTILGTPGNRNHGFIAGQMMAVEAGGVRHLLHGSVVLHSEVDVP